MIRIGIAYGVVRIGTTRYLHLGIDHKKRPLGDGLKRVGIQMGIVRDEFQGVRGLHVSPYYIGPYRERFQNLLAAAVAVLLFAASIYALHATDVDMDSPSTTIAQGVAR